MIQTVQWWHHWWNHLLMSHVQKCASVTCHSSWILLMLWHFLLFIANLILEWWEKKGVRAGWICGERGTWDNSHATTGQKCPHFQTGVSRSSVVVEKPISRVPLLRLFLSCDFPWPFHVEMVYSLSMCNDLVVQNFMHIKGKCWILTITPVLNFQHRFNPWVLLIISSPKQVLTCWKFLLCLCLVWSRACCIYSSLKS